MAAVSAAVMAATASSYVGNHAARKASEAAARRAENRECEVEVVVHSKCPGCGSFEFEMHGRRSVCSYCRTPQVG